MNQGVFDGMNHGATPFISNQFYTGYWGDLRPILGSEEIGNAQLLNPNTNLTLGVPYINPNQAPQETGWMTACLETPFDAEAFELQCLGAWSQSGLSACFSITIGIVVANNVLTIMDRFVVGSRYTPINSAGDGDINVGPFPIFIPAGSKVVYKLNLEASTSTAIMTGGLAVLVHLHKRHPRSGNRSSLISEFPNGLQLTTTTADVDSSYQTIGFLPFDTLWVIPCNAFGGTNNSYAVASFIVDFCFIEKNGSTNEFLSNIVGMSKSNESQWCLNRPYPVNLSAGTEIQARVSVGATSNQFFFPGLMAIGVDHVDSGRRPIGPTSLAIS